MPQYLTLSIGAKVDKGPDIKSEAKVEISNYAPLCEELVCKCTTQGFDVATFAKKDLPLYALIVADKYSSDKDCVQPNRLGACDPKKFIKFQLWKDNAPVGGDANKWEKLDRPLIWNSVPDFDNIVFKNDLTIDVKVSLLVFRIAPECVPAGANGSDCTPAKPAPEVVPKGQGTPVYQPRPEHSVLR